MGHSESSMVCLKHTNHHKPPGVCSCCLRERLYQVLAVSEQQARAMISSTDSTLASPSDSLGGSNSSSRRHRFSSASSSIYLSPLHIHHRRDASEAADSLFFTVRIGGGGGGDGGELKKSKSIAFVPRREEVSGEGTKKRGFWSKLLHLRGGSGRRKEDRLMHHHRRTLKEAFY